MMERSHAAAFANGHIERELTMSFLMNAGAVPSSATANALRFGGILPNLTSAGSPPSANGLSNQLPLAATTTATNQDLFRLQCELLNREIATRNAFAVGAAVGAAAAGLPQHPSLSNLLAQQTNPVMTGLTSGNVAAMSASRAAVSPGSSPTFKPVDTTLSPSQQQTLVGASSTLKRPLGNNQLQGLSAAMAAARRNSLLGITSGAFNLQGPSKRPRHGTDQPSSPSSNSSAVAPSSQAGSQGDRRGSKAKLRDDFWGKVGKNNSHIHLVNIVLGRLLHEEVRKTKFGNKVLSNGLIQQILDTKLYGKYAVRDFFASSNKGSETVRNTWTRLNFSSDDIRKGLSRYKEQTWQAIERCGFEDNVSDEDKAEMSEALKIFVTTNRFVNALEVALNGIITEDFIAILMQLRLEWNGLCLNCRPEEHDAVVLAFLRKYGLSGK